MEENIPPFLSQAKSLILSPQNRLQIVFLLIGAVLITGSFLIKTNNNKSTDKGIEVISDESSVKKENQQTLQKLVIDIRGAVISPGVYDLDSESRVEDVITLAGGLSEDADLEWLDKNLVRSAKVVDGQKIYIPNKQSSVLSASISTNNTNVAQSESTITNDLINVNTASLSDLDTLPGIGRVYGQKIIDHRPYSTLDELVSKGALKQSVFEKIKDQVTLF